MTVFLLASAALVLITLAFVLRPLWQARPLAGAGMFAVIAVATGALYALIGAPAALDPEQRNPPTSIASAEDLPAAVAQLEAALKRDPTRLEGWLLLARVQAAQGNRAAVRDAYARAVKLAPDDADILVQSAESRALANQPPLFDDEGVGMLRHALKVQPAHQRARWFLGIAQRQAEQPAEAAKTWEPLLTTITDERTLASLRLQIDSARKDAGQPPLPPAAPRAAAATEGGLKVRVVLSPRLKAKLPADASLFVLARQPGGPPMPVAVEKLAAKDFPVEVVLDDGDSPMPTMKLSQLPQAQVLARVSASGNAIPQPGDLASEPVTVSIGTQDPVAITIDRVVE